jgi:hypothetical protein
MTIAFKGGKYHEVEKGIPTERNQISFGTRAVSTIYE